MSEENSRTRYCAFCLTTFLGTPSECPNKDCSKPITQDGSGWLLEPGERIDGRFRIDRRLIIGGAGVTYLCQETDEDEQALGPLLLIQVLSHRGMASPYFDKLKSQVDTMVSLSHPSIIRVNELVESEQYQFVVSCYEGGGNLMEQLREAGAMSVTHLAQLGLQMCSALKAAHREGVIHGDVKPENVLLDHIPEEGEPPLIRLSDFGVLSLQDASINAGDDGMSVSSLYAAPERILGGEATDKSDIFSLGALLLFCLNLRPIVSGAEKMEPVVLAARLSSSIPPRWEPPRDYPVDKSQLAFINAVLTATMAEVPAERCTLDEVQHYLEALLEVEESDAEDMFETPDWALEDSEPEPPPEVEFQPFKAEGAEVDQNAQDEGEPEEQEAVVEEDLPPWWYRHRKLISYSWFTVSIVSMVGFCFVWYLYEEVLSPSHMESRGPEPYELVSGDPIRAPDYRAISDSLFSQLDTLDDCDLEVDRITVWIIVEPDGSVRAADTSYLPLFDAWCVRGQLLDLTIDRRTGGTPYRFRTNISL